MARGEMALPSLLTPAPLTDLHHIQAFESGVYALDTWLMRRARANQASGASRVYVLANEGGVVVGYYALASGALALSDAPNRIRRNMPDPVPVAILGRLAISKTHQGKGLGVALLQDAVMRVRTAATILGIRGVLVHALSQDAKRFYEHHGFIAGTNAPMTLVLSLL